MVLFGLLLWFRLGSLTGGYSAEEAAALQAGSSLSQIFENPLNAPFTLLAYLFSLIFTGEQALLSVRAAATVIGLLTLTAFYWLVRHWHGERTAVLGTVIFGSSAWFLHTARLGTPDVALFLLLVLVAGSVWFKKTDYYAILFAGFILTATLLYVPGMIWPVLFVTLWQAKTILRFAKKHLGFFLFGLFGVLALIAPLLWALWRSPGIARDIAGLPAGFNWTGALERLGEVPYQLFVHGPADPVIWLGRLPVLDVFSMVMLIFGAYLYFRYRHLARSKMVAASLTISLLLIALGGAVTLSIIIPFVYLLVAAGIGFMLDRWQRVFPRNIIAQSVSVGLISLAVIIVGWYGLRHYFVAWPNAPATRQ
ncbi:hypothetical protein IRY61_06660, partial [Candidatus Saccharibacteria bacterium]|nr:hypothetical protein [Candidatus Saccharibacteria bacterium]